MDRKKIKLNVMGVSYSQTKGGAYALILSEERGDRRIPIIIGGVEAQSISMKLENLESPRPLTHDLFHSFAVGFSIDLIEVNIFKLEEGIFYSEMIFKNKDKTIKIDCRTSDAVAMAVRFHCPIHTYEDILIKAGIILEQGNSQIQKKKYHNENSKMASVSTDALKKLLNDAIKKENYERASEIRDEINKRENEPPLLKT